MWLIVWAAFVFVCAASLVLLLLALVILAALSCGCFAVGCVVNRCGLVSVGCKGGVIASVADELTL